MNESGERHGKQTKKSTHGRVVMTEYKHITTERLDNLSRFGGPRGEGAKA